MSTFLLKIIAMFTMFCDHISYALFGVGQITFLNCIGRFAMIIFCFQIVLGYKKTKSLKKYLARLFLIALISQIPYSMLFQTISYTKLLNVDFTLFLGLLAISILNFHVTYDGNISFRDNNYKCIEFSSIKSIIIFFLKCLLIFIICYFMANLKNVFGYGIEYGYKAVLFIICIYLFYPFEKKKDISKILLYIISIIVFAFMESQMWFGKDDFVIPAFYNSKDLISYISIYVFCIIGGLIPLLYNGKKGKSIKWTTYLFYPVHLLLIYLIYIFIIM